MPRITVSLLFLLNSIALGTCHAELEPLAMHHAHIKNEFRNNVAYREDVREVEVNKETGEEEVRLTDVFEHVLEIGIASSDSVIGVEAHIPFSNSGTEEGGDRVYGLGDMEIEAIRYAWVHLPELVWTTSLGVTVPTGDEASGLGEGKVSIEPHFLLDAVHGDWAFSANVIPGIELGKGEGRSLEWGLMAAYSFLHDKIACSVELLGESGFGPSDGGFDSFQVLPGIHLEHGGWDWRFGVSIPLTRDRKEERVFLLQAGTHWDNASMN